MSEKKVEEVRTMRAASAARSKWMERQKRGIYVGKEYVIVTVNVALLIPILDLSDTFTPFGHPLLASGHCVSCDICA